MRELIAAAPLATPRYEVVDGELLVTPSPAPPHQLAIGHILFELALYLREQPVAEVLMSPSDIEVEPEQVTQPDIFVLSNAEADRITREGFPALDLFVAIEVVSPSSARYDRVTKRALYHRHIPEYWIVDVDARVIERWRRGNDRPEILTATLEWSPEGATRPFTLDLPSLFAGAWRERQPPHG
ncbi:MAG: Uma2 family endonuclease [Gemmatimonadaceae bacterium]